jgi:hypothetical protein
LKDTSTLAEPVIRLPALQLRELHFNPSANPDFSLFQQMKGMQDGDENR